MERENVTARVVRHPAGRPARFGDRMRLICGYEPTTVKLHDVIFAEESNQVADVWPDFPRGPGHCGFLQSLNSAA